MVDQICLGKAYSWCLCYDNHDRFWLLIHVHFCRSFSDRTEQCHVIRCASSLIVHTKAPGLTSYVFTESHDNNLLKQCMQPFTTKCSHYRMFIPSVDTICYLKRISNIFSLPNISIEYAVSAYELSTCDALHYI